MTGTRAGSGDRVRQITPTAELTALSALDPISYQDAFAVRLSPQDTRTAEQWARAILERAPQPLRSTLPAGWTALGLRHNTAPPEQSVLGWPIRGNTAAHLELAAESRIGLPAELHFLRHRDELLFSTIVQHRNPAASALWRAIIPGHQRIVADLLRRAAARDPAAD